MKYFDAHTHVQFAAFEQDYKGAVDRALAADIGMLLVGTQRETSRRGVEVAEEYKNNPVYAAIGLHPIHTTKSYHDKKELGGGEIAKEFTSHGDVFDYDYYEKLAQHGKVVAIGECGLDYYRLEKGTKEKQERAFEAQVQLAGDIDKPLMIHCREAFPDLIDILSTHHPILNTPPGIIHFFSGTRDNAKRLLELGFSFTFGGVVTFTDDYNEVVKYIPLDRILSETDAPYVAPVPYRGKRNEPLYVMEIVKKLAELKEISAEEMAQVTVENAKRMFGI